MTTTQILVESTKATPTIAAGAATHNTFTFMLPIKLLDVHSVRLKDIRLFLGAYTNFPSYYLVSIAEFGAHIRTGTLATDGCFHRGMIAGTTSGAVFNLVQNEFTDVMTTKYFTTKTDLDRLTMRVLDPTGALITIPAFANPVTTVDVPVSFTLEFEWGILDISNGLVATG